MQTTQPFFTSRRPALPAKSAATRRPQIKRGIVSKTVQHEEEQVGFVCQLFALSLTSPSLRDETAVGLDHSQRRQFWA